MRPVIRWTLRLLRREWRAQLLVLSLLTVAVTVGVGGTAAVYSLEPVGHAGEFGTANLAFRFGGADQAELGRSLETIRSGYGRADVIGRRQVLLRGGARLIEFRAQDPAGPYGRPMLALREGRYPAGRDEVAVTEEIARILDLAPGSRFTLDQNEWTVVGLVENPSNLRDAFVLVAPAHAGQPTTVTVLARGDPDAGLVALENFNVAIADLDPGEDQLMAAVVALVGGSLALLLVALVAAAGFAVVGRRRQRQLGMLAAIGATERQLRLVMVANGAAVGLVAACVGAAAGLLGWMAAVPAMEPVVQARIDRSQVVPWWLVAVTMVLAVLVSAAAAWWPARALSRVPVVRALSGRPGPPSPVRGPMVAAAVLVVAGLTAMAAADPLAGLFMTAGSPAGAGGAGGFSAGSGDAGGFSLEPLLTAAGAFVAACGVLLASPVAIRLLAAVVPRAPVPVRLAVRDLVRHQSRSAAALAATSLALGLAASVVLAVGVAERDLASGNLSERQLIVTEERNRIRELVTIRTPDGIAHLRARVGEIAATLDDPAVIPLLMPVDPREPARPGRDNTMRTAFRHAVQIGDGPRTARPGPLFVATPELLAIYGIDAATLDPGVDVLTVRQGEVGLRHMVKEEVVTRVQRLDTPAYTMAPTSLITAAGLERRDWKGEFAGFLVQAGEPLTSAQIANAYIIASGTSMMVIARDSTSIQDLRMVRTGMITVGAVAALAVLALSVGLVRGESAGDLRTLTATGASGRVRRAITASTVGALAVLGVVLGVGGAYLGLAALYFGEFEVLLPVPVGHLALVGAGVPALATLGGWLLAGKEPAVISRRVLE